VSAVPEQAVMSGLAPLRAESRALNSLPKLALAFDALAVCFTVLLAAFGRSQLFLFDAPVPVQESVAPVAVPLMICWIAVIGFRGGYDRGIFGAGADEYKAVVGASLLTAAMLGIACYLTKFQLSRGFFVFAFILGPILLALSRWSIRRWIHRERRHGLLQQRTVMIGGSDHVDAIAGVLTRESWLGYAVSGAITPASQQRSNTSTGIPVLGTVEEAAALIRASEAQVVFVAGGAFTHPSQMRDLVWDLESDNVQVIMAPGVTDVSSERVRVRPVAGLPLLHLDRPRSQDALRWAKRIFDVVAASVLLALASPLMLWAAARIKLHDRGPVLFRQKRVGRDGAYFTCLKFRSMVVDAEQALTVLHQQTGYDSGLFKMRQDPRITKPGRWMRRYSLDELPQLINVLRGDMSLIGPRPPLPIEVDRYTLTQSRRLRVRPGLTGLWQVSGRSDLSWEEAIRLDLYYVDNWSMIQDLQILGRTLKAVLGSRGAY
jgi:exopolysaccharide biosynthesis polyprenyl glycosylphosphotransferase